MLEVTTLSSSQAVWRGSECRCCLLQLTHLHRRRTFLCMLICFCMLCIDLPARMPSQRSDMHMRTWMQDCRFKTVCNVSTHHDIMLATCNQPTMKMHLEHALPSTHALGQGQGQGLSSTSAAAGLPLLALTLHLTSSPINLTYTTASSYSSLHQTATGRQCVTATVTVKRCCPVILHPHSPRCSTGRQ